MVQIQTSRDKQIAKKRPSVTTAVSAFTPTTLELTGAEVTRGVQPRQVTIRQIIVCNVSTSDQTYRLFFDETGSTADETTAIAWNVEILVGESHFINTLIVFTLNEGNISVRSSTANALTFTFFGDELGA